MTQSINDRDRRQIGLMKLKIDKERELKGPVTEVELSAALGSKNAELYLAYMGQWEILLGVPCVRINIKCDGNDIQSNDPGIKYLDKAFKKLLRRPMVLPK